MSLQDELRRAQACEQAGQAAEAIAILESQANADDPFVPWIWYFAAIIADRNADVDRLLSYSARFGQSDQTMDPDYRAAHVDLLVRRVVRLSQRKQPVGDDVAALMRHEPSRDELDLIYSNLFDYVLPARRSLPPDRTVKLGWRRWKEHSAAIRIGAPHYALEKRDHPVPVPQLYFAREACYLTNGAEGWLWRGGAWFRRLGSGPSAEEALAQLRARGRRPVKLPGRGLILGDQFSGDNYCHWTMDWVPRALLAAEFGGGFDWLFVRGSRKPFQLDWLRILGVDPFHVIFEDGLAWFECDEFVYSDSGNIPVTNPAYGGHPEVVQRIRWCAQAAFGPPPPPTRRIYISREDGGGRAILNQAEVQAVLVRHGFETVALSRLTLAEQVTLFGGAQAVVGVHGAGLTNVIYARPDTPVIELLHHRYGTKSFALPALKAGLRYAYLSCPGSAGEVVPEKPNPPAGPTDFITAAIYVDPAMLDDALTRLAPRPETGPP